ncbi:serine/threonine-protein kinase [Longimicrobium sp.]|jgi:serine/threonine-protein kinase|uniref:serine/threonine-protein kinase n=1 Tax=Longimicrobium sp. TaxID=2029185 RepID=UPI002EDBA311
MYGIAGLLTGRTLCGRYRIEAVVGRGGMGAVYRALDERLGRAVAVKVIGIVAHEPAEHARLQARFLREARAAAALHHPNVVAIHDFGADEELGLDFLVMELLHGEDLAMRLARSGPPPTHVSLSILRQAARGLAAGHRVGMVHRDVKPGNLFLLEGDHADDLHVRVLDFGIAQVAGDEGATAAQLTEYGRAPFSPAYASPEQMRGDDRITPASDVFSLGAVGYHLLTGLRPFTATDAGRMAMEAAESVRMLPERAPHLPRAVVETLQRAMAANPAQRFRDAAEFAEALSTGATPLSSEPPVHTATTPPPVRTPRASLAAAVSVEPSPDDETRMQMPPPARGHASIPAPAMYAPPPAHAYPSAAAPTAYPAAAAPPAAYPPAAYPPPRAGAMRRFARGLWQFIITCTALALFVGAWALASMGVTAEDTRWVYAGAAAAILFTPLAVHRLNGGRGRLGLGVAACMLATGGAVYYVGTDGDPAITLAAVFGVQVVASFITLRLTRRRLPLDAYHPGT